MAALMTICSDKIKQNEDLFSVDIAGFEEDDQHLLTHELELRARSEPLHLVLDILKLRKII